MKAYIKPQKMRGHLRVPPSKSHTQRACACALLSQGTSHIEHIGKSEDEKVVYKLIEDLGAQLHFTDYVPNKQVHALHKESHTKKTDSKMQVENATYALKITSCGLKPKHYTLVCGESGLAMRLFMPIAALLTRPMRIGAKGTLLDRSQTSFEEIASQLNLSFASNNGLAPIFIQGPLLPQNMTVDGRASSQFLSGLLIAYAAKSAVNCSISVQHLTSQPYVQLTLDVLKNFGYHISHENYQVFRFDKIQKLRAAHVRVAGDWSAGAYLLVAAALSGLLCIQGLRKNSAQADESILDILKQAQCPLIRKHQLEAPDETSIEMDQATLQAFHCNLEHSPDLFPALTALAVYAQGTSYLSGLHRLVNKESNRAKAIMETLDRVGVKYEKNGDTLCVEGVDYIEGGQHMPSYGDHRIAMMSTLLALRSRQGLVVENSEVVAKSFPDFFTSLQKAGLSVHMK